MKHFHYFFSHFPPTHSLEQGMGVPVKAAIVIFFSSSISSLIFLKKICTIGLLSLLLLYVKYMCFLFIYLKKLFFIHLRKRLSLLVDNSFTLILKGHLVLKIWPFQLLFFQLAILLAGGEKRNVFVF